MIELTEDQRTRALELYRQHFLLCTGMEAAITDIRSLSPVLTEAWVGVEKFVLQSHTCTPKWRPTTAREIQPGWEIRSRWKGSPQTWGTAHHRGSDGNWYTKTYSMLSNDKAGWILETTVPLPKPDPLIQVVLDWANDLGGRFNPEDAAELLTKLDAFKEGEEA